MGLGIRVSAHFCSEIKCRSLEFVDIESEIEQDGHDFLSIETAADTELVNRTAFAVDHQVVRLIFSEQFICNIVETVGSVNRRHSILDGVFADGHIRIDADFPLKILGLLVSDAMNLHSRNPHRLSIYIDGPAVLKFCLSRADNPLKAVQRNFLGSSRFPSTLENRGNAFVIEAHHIELVQSRTYRHIRNGDIAFIGLAAEHIHALGDDVTEVVQLGIVPESGGQVHADDYVRPHFLGNVGRIVVPHASVHEHHPVHFHRSEHSRNGHRRTQCRVQLAVIPDLRLGCHHLGRHTDERNRQVHEVHIVLVTDCQ